MVAAVLLCLVVLTLFCGHRKAVSLVPLMLSYVI